MAALTLDALLRSLKKGAPPPETVFVLYGDEAVLKDEAVLMLVDAAVGSSRDFNLDMRYALNLSPESFHALVNTPPMLAERRAVVIRGVEQLGKRKTKLRDEVLRYLATPNPTTLLVLVVAAGEEPDPDILRASTATRLDALAAERIPRWLQHRATTLALTLAPDAADLLLKAVGNDLATLSRELEKLASLDTGSGTSRPVTVEDVSSLVGVRRNETIFDLVGTALARSERDRGVSPNQLPDTLYRQLQAVRPYGLRRYKDEAARWSAWSARWTAQELGDALRAALAADNALKTATVSDDRGIVTQLVLGFAKLNQEAA